MTAEATPLPKPSKSRKALRRDLSPTERSFADREHSHTLPTLRVLHVVNGEHYAGAERVQDLLALRLPEVGIDVEFVCLKPNRFPVNRQSQSTPLTALPMVSRFDLRPAWRLARMVRSRQFDLIHTHTPRAALVGQIAARLADVPLVHHVHGHTATEIGRNWFARLAAHAERMSLSRAAGIIAVSSSAAEYIHRWGVAKERIFCVPNGVPARRPLLQRATPQENWNLGMVALLRPRKGLEVLLESLSLLHQRGIPVQLRVIGEFETSHYQEQTRQLARVLGISQWIQWRGFRSDINAELDQLDLLILPSLLAEGMPMVVLEAMAAGVPPIGSRVDGIADVICDGHNGLLCEPGNAAALAQTLTDVITGKHDWQILSRNAVLSHADRFSDTAMAAGVAAVYRQVLKQ